jgi:hypothetical protein
MAIRPLTKLEKQVAEALVSLAEVRSWEFAAFLETADGPLIEIRTLMRRDGADPSEDVHSRADQGAQIVVHHNHLTQESLSDADWKGLTELFSETFAHCSDGTMYWGRAKDKDAVRKVMETPSLENDATNLLCQMIRSDPDSSTVGAFFRKEILNRAMRVRGIVDYEYAWGSTNALPVGSPWSIVTPANEWGKRFDRYINEAAKSLARRF